MSVGVLLSKVCINLVIVYACCIAEIDLTEVSFEMCSRRLLFFFRSLRYLRPSRSFLC